VEKEGKTWQEIIGDEGEEEFDHVLMEAVKQLGIDVKIFRNLIFEFDSICGENGKMTVENDRIIVSKDKIILVEVKNGHYLNHWDYGADTWILLNGDTESNPVSQNQYHKKVLQLMYGERLGEIYTIEAIMKYKGLRYKTDNANDYVLGKDNLLRGLVMLLATPGNVKNYEELIREFEDVERVSHARKLKHKENLHNYEEKNKRLKSKKQMGYIPFRLTDVAYCKCGGLLILKDWKKCRQRQYLVGCVNYKDKVSEKGEHDCYYYDSFKDIKIIHIENRIGDHMMEEDRYSILDDYYKMEGEINRLGKEKKQLEEELVAIKKALARKTKEKELLEVKLKRFKPLFWLIYLKQK